MEDVHPDWIQYPYLVTEDTDPNSTLTVPANKGNEAMRYLSFIIDNYDSLPDIIAFHEYAWHQSFGSAAEVNNLNLTTVRFRGYQNFKCDAVPSGCDEHILLADKQRWDAQAALSPLTSPSRRSHIRVLGRLVWRSNAGRHHRSMLRTVRRREGSRGAPVQKEIHWISPMADDLRSE